MRRNATVLTALLVLLACVPAARAEADLGLLREHAPVLHHDAREAGRATAVEALTPRVAGEAVTLRPRVRPLPDVVYGRVVRRGGTFLQYWMLYADNPQDRGVVRTGRHEGDWELVQVRLAGATGKPAAATYAQHGWAARCGWSGDVFVAHGSHASYPTAGEHGRPWPDPDDEARGDGRVMRPQVRAFGSWVTWPGRWGRTEAGWVPAESDSPRGPAFQDTAAWADPARYEREARACADGAPPHPWPVYAGASTLLLALLLVGVKVARGTSELAGSNLKSTDVRSTISHD